MVHLGYFLGSQGDWLDHAQDVEFGWWVPPSAEQLVCRSAGTCVLPYYLSAACSDMS